MSDYFPLGRTVADQATANFGAEPGLDDVHRNTPVAIAVQQNNASLASKKLRELFHELLDFMSTEMKHVNVCALRLHLAKFFEHEEELNDETFRHLRRIEDYSTSEAILDYFVRHDFIGYINFSLIKIFQEITKSPLLDKRINEYMKDYDCFLELALIQIHGLSLNYPAGLPEFTIHILSQLEWNGKSILDLQEFIKKCFANINCANQLMIAKISPYTITYAVLPNIAAKLIGYLTNDDVVMSMKKEGISIEISKQLMKYKEELETTSMEQTSGKLLGLETDLTSYNSQATGILAIKHDWDDTATVTDITNGYGDGETNEYSRLVELKDDVTVKETVDISEKVVNMLRKRIKSLESQLVTHKQMMMELDNTRDELQKTKKSLNLIQDKLIKMEIGKIEVHEPTCASPEEETDYSEQFQLEKYSVDCIPRGYCVIINNDKFTGQLPPRPGSSKDVEDLQSLFGDLLWGFEVLTFINTTEAEMMLHLQEIANIDHSYYSAFFIIAMSHGDKGGIIFTHDCKPVSISSIASHFTINQCPSLAGKPKVLLLQACQGDEMSRAIQSPNPNLTLAARQIQKDCGDLTLIDPNTTVNEVDFLFGFASIQGRSAIRDSQLGSWYIQEFVSIAKSMSNAGGYSFTAILDKVTNKLSHYNLGNISQISTYQSTLRKQLCLGQVWNFLSFVNSNILPILHSKSESMVFAHSKPADCLMKIPKQIDQSPCFIDKPPTTESISRRVVGSVLLCNPEPSDMPLENWEMKPLDTESDYQPQAHSASMDLPQSSETPLTSNTQNPVQEFDLCG